MDEIQYASERDLAIRNVDRESTLLRQVKAALRRIHDGGFGICIDCDSAISPKRLAAVPWAPRCIQCQEAADRTRGRRRADGEPEFSSMPRNPLVEPPSGIRTIAFLGNYLPRKCGIATFTSDLLGAVAARHPQSQCFAVPVNDIDGMLPISGSRSLRD